MAKTKEKLDTRVSPATTSLARPPIVAVLGHVDHGKTSLLDAIRKTNVVAREHGGITQAIGAFSTTTITFIDTPGHEAFAKMRSRGVKACDIVILVVASDDGVMPQTKEAISHIKEAKIPFVVALTKADVAGANPEKVKQQLLAEGVGLEGMGGEVPVVSVSSKTGEGIDDLLEVILLVGQLTGIKGVESDPLEAVVIEAARDKRKGTVASLIIQKGTLAVGDEVVAEGITGKIRAIVTDTGATIKMATPGMPVEVLGFSDIPMVGTKVTKRGEAVVQQEALSLPPNKEIAVPAPIDPETRRLPVILKGNTQGSLEAILQSIPKDEVKIILATSGDPSEGDILLAKATSAIVIGFNTTISGSVAKLAETEGIIVKNYKLIYELLDELDEVIALFKQGKAQEIILGKAQILALFPYDKKTVAGCKIIEGRIARGDKIRIERERTPIGEARIVSLRQGKEEVGKVESGAECGIILSVQLDFVPSDMILSVR